VSAAFSSEFALLLTMQGFKYRQNAERFIGQRRSAGLFGLSEKIGRRGGELKTYWTEPAGLAGEFLYGR